MLPSTRLSTAHARASSSWCCWRTPRRSTSRRRGRCSRRTPRWRLSAPSSLRVWAARPRRCASSHSTCATRSLPSRSVSRATSCRLTRRAGSPRTRRSHPTHGWSTAVQPSRSMHRRHGACARSWHSTSTMAHSATTCARRSCACSTGTPTTLYWPTCCRGCRHTGRCATCSRSFFVHYGRRHTAGTSPRSSRASPSRAASRSARSTGRPYGTLIYLRSGLGGVIQDDDDDDHSALVEAGTPIDAPLWDLAVAPEKDST